MNRRHLKNIFYPGELLSTVVLCSVFLWLTACTRPGNPTAIAPVSSPVQISSSAQVVRVATSPVALRPSESIDAEIKLSISPGFHVNANPATFPYLIATEVLPEKADGITAGKPIYPAAVSQEFKFAEQPLAVYQGEVVIKIPLRATTGSGERSLPIKLRVQACDEEKCYPPSTVNVSIPVNVN